MSSLSEDGLSNSLVYDAIFKCYRIKILSRPDLLTTRSQEVLDRLRKLGAFLDCSEPLLFQNASCVHSFYKIAEVAHSLQSFLQVGRLKESSRK